MQTKLDRVREYVCAYLKERQAGLDGGSAMLDLLEYIIEENLFLWADSDGTKLIYSTTAESGLYPVDKADEHMFFAVPSEGDCFFGFDRLPTESEYKKGVKYYQF